MSTARGSGRLSPKALTAVRREREVVQLKMEGLTFDQIAAKVGYSNRGAAKKAFDRAQQRSPVNAPDEIRLLELLRLEDLQQSATRCLDRATTHDQRLRCVDVVLELNRHRNDLTYDFREYPTCCRGSRCDDRADQLLDGVNPTPAGPWTKPLQLCEQGLPFKTIADRLGLPNAAAAERRVEADLDMYTAETIDAHRAQVLDPNEQLFRELWPIATAPKAKPADIFRVLKTMRTRAKILQLYPTAKDITERDEQEQKRMAKELQDIINSEPNPGYPIIGGPIPNPITPEFLETIRQAKKAMTQHSRPDDHNRH